MSEVRGRRMIRWLTFLNLLYPADSDVRHREFFVWPILAGAGAEAVIALLCGSMQQGVWPLVAGCIPGVLVCLYSLITKGAVGMGDGLCILVTGFFIGAEDTFVICISGFMAAAAVGLILIARGQRRAALPYMPFFTAFYILNWYFAWKG